MTKRFCSALLFIAIFLLLPPAGRAQATPSEIKLLTQNTGWALMGGHLFWTNDFGKNWRNITPPLAPAGVTAIDDVFFLNTSTGWALLRTQGRTLPDGVVFGDWGYELAYTDNAGASWTVTPIRLLGLPKRQDLGGGGAVDFVDSAHGWMDLSLDSMLQRGILFSTNDGGRTWRRVPGAPMIAASINFVTPEDGWLAGGQGGGSLYATRDGGETWTRVVLRSPLRLGKYAFSAYGLPVFTDPEHGAIVVTDPWGKWLTLFTTRDGGRKWTPIASLSHLPAAGTVPAIPVDSKLLAGWVSDRAQITLTAVGARTRKRAVGSIHTKGPYIPAVTALTFRNTDSGWAIAGGLLHSTTDGGATWTDITPTLSMRTQHFIPKRTSSQESPSTPPASAAPLAPTTSSTAIASTGGGGGGKTVGSLHTSTHLGFDSSTAALPGSMQTWWTYSPYYDYGFYLGGGSTSYALKNQYGTGTPNPSITPAQWVSDVVNQGWGLIPFWVGPQAPCTTGFATIKPADAQTEGGQEADAAISEASGSSGVGLPQGSIIYYDMEYYDPTNATCQAAVTSFIKG